MVKKDQMTSTMEAKRSETALTMDDISENLGSLVDCVEAKIQFSCATCISGWKIEG